MLDGVIFATMDSHEFSRPEHGPRICPTCLSVGGSSQPRVSPHVQANSLPMSLGSGCVCPVCLTLYLGLYAIGSLSHEFQAKALGGLPIPFLQEAFPTQRVKPDFPAVQEDSYHPEPEAPDNKINPS